MVKNFQTRWRGILLSLIGIVTIMWLAFTDQLGLYIHPRYFVFTVVMAALAAVFVLLAFALPPRAEPDSHTHDDAPSIERGNGWWAAGSIVIVLATAVAMLVLPPAVLTTSTVEQRDINGSVGAASQDETIELAGGDYSSFTVKDWAGLLRQGVDERFLAGTTPTIVGFVTPDTDDPENVFYVARFVITCCAVDAQPIGVPVYSPGWQNDYASDDWVEVTGSFVANPSVTSLQAMVLTPATINAIDRPNQPYVY